MKKVTKALFDKIGRLVETVLSFVIIGSESGGTAGNRAAASLLYGRRAGPAALRRKHGWVAGTFHFLARPFFARHSAGD